MDEICVGDRNRKKEEIHAREWDIAKYGENIDRFIFYLEIIVIFLDTKITSKIKNVVHSV